jgi:O-antigen ligase
MLATAQYIKRSSLGIKIESTTDLPYNGVGADEDSSQVRPVGLTSHANILAFDVMNTWLFGFLLWITLEKRQKKRMGKKLVMGFLCATLTIILTQSRSVYLGWLIVCLALIWKSDTFMIDAQGILKLIKRFKPIILACIPVITYLVITRALFTLESFNPQAGGGTRDFLIREAQQLILKNPVFGVGAGMFIPAAFEQNVTKVMSYFPESVHNGFLLLISEGGFITFSIYVCGLSSLIWIAKKNGYRALFLATIVAILANSIVMLFQPFAGILPLAVIGIFFAQYALQNTQKNPLS